MPSEPVHTTISAYQLSKKLVVACYELTHDLPEEEKTNLSRYLRTAAVSIHLHLSEGPLIRKKKKRKKWRRTIGRSLVVINAAVDVMVEVKLADPARAADVSGLTQACYNYINTLKKAK